MWWLRLKGYAILAQRFKRPGGEIDIIALRNQTLVFVEVKQRPTLELAQSAVPTRAWRRIARTADAWIAARSDRAGYNCRFDLIAITAKGFPKHFRDYWRP